MKTGPQRVTTAIFLLFLAAFAAWGARNPNLRIDSDPSAYLRFAETLARGDYFIDEPGDEVFREHYPPNAIHRGTYTTIMLGPHRGVVYYAIGFPLFLSLFIRAGGIYGAFFANLVVFLALFALLRAATRRLFAGHPAAEAAGLLAPALYYLFNRGEVYYFLAPYRDPLAHLLLLASILSLLLHVQEGRRTRHLALAGLFLGLATAVRETAVLAALPIGLFWGWQAWKERLPPRPAPLAAFALAALIGVSPLLVQNAVNTGNPLYPTQVLHAQVRTGNVLAPEDEKRYAMRGLNLRHFPRTEPQLVRRLLQDYDPLFLALLAAGLAAGARFATVPLLLLPFVAVFTLFFGLWVKPLMRYLFVTQVAVAPLLALGAAALADKAGRLARLPRLPTAAAGGALLAAAGLLLAAPAPGRFGLAEARSFERDLEAAVPAGALVIAERPMRDVVEHLTHASGLYPDDFTRPERGLTFAVAMEHYRKAFAGIYFLDNPDGDLRDAVADTPVTRERLLQHYDLLPVARFAASRYGAERVFGAPEITLWRVVPWEKREVAARLALPAGGPAILRLNGRGIAHPIPAEIRVGDAVVGRELRPGLNWFLAGADGDGPREVVLRVAAAAPLPGDLDPVIADPEAPIALDAGPGAVPLAETFLSPETLWLPDPGGYRGLAGARTATVPAAGVPGTTLVLALHTRMPPGTKDTRVVFGPGEPVARLVRGNARQQVGVELAPAPAAPAESRAETSVRVENLPPGAGGKPRRLPVERLVVHRVRLAPLPLRIDFRTDAAAALLVEGFHEAERGLPGRWTSGDAKVFLPLAAADAGRGLRLTLRFGGLPEGEAARLRLAANGVALGDFPVAPGVGHEASCAIPAGVLRPGLNELVIAGPSWRPAGHESDNARMLGLALDELRLEEAR